MIVSDTLRRLFFYQSDHHAEQWRNKAGDVGYSPACDGRFSDDCKAQGYRCDSCSHKAPTTLTDERIAQHLAGKITLGAYQLREDGTVGWLCIDVDCDEDSPPARHSTRTLTITARDKMAQMGLPVVVEFTGNKGFHLWVFFPDGAPAILMRRLGLWIMEQAIDELGELHGIHYEVFPKQDSLDARHGYGNLVKVPLGKHKKTNRWCVFLDHDLRPVQDQREYLEQIETTTATDLAAVVEDWIPDDWASPDETRRATDKPARLDGPIANGKRNDTLTSLAGTMRRRGMSEDSIYAALLVENQRCDPPLDDDEIRQIAASVGRYRPAPRNFPLTDMGNAERLVARYGNEMRYCHAWGRWLVWDGRRWQIDETGAIVRLAKDTVRSMYVEADNLANDDMRQDLIKWALKSEADARLTAMISLAESEPGVPVLVDDLDQDEWLLNCANGTLDLHTGELRAHDPIDLITKVTPVAYVPDAQCSTWMRFEHQISGDDDALLAHKQRAFGYALTGSTQEQCLFILYGTGSNGKSTELNAIRAVLGTDYAMHTPTETLMVKSYSGGVPNDVARLRGARYVTAIESEMGRRIAESLIKQMTGGDTMTARFMRAEWFEFTPTHKLFLAVNHKPVIRGTDHAIWRRIRLWPYAVTIPDNQQDKSLSEKLEHEAEGILAWLVQGCLGWQRQGLCAPDSVTAATEKYRNEMDMLGEFIEDRCVEKPTAIATSAALYSAYTAWCEVNGEKPISKKLMGMRLQERGYAQDRTATARQWVGIGLLANDDDGGAPSNGDGHDEEYGPNDRLPF